MLQDVERLIQEINHIHEVYSVDYFESGKVDKINLSHTISKVPLNHILNYRLNLHESINDYLIQADLKGIEYFYRVKTSESIIDKIDRYSKREDQYPVNNWLNDIFGCRMILNQDELDLIEDQLDGWQAKYHLKNWYKRNADDYKGIHIYFKNQSNFFFPWELQLWNIEDVELNIKAHRLYKRQFASQYAKQDNH